MKNRIGIIEYGFIKNYVEELVNLCQKNNIKIDLFSFEKESELTKYAENIYFLETEYNSKDFKSIQSVEKEIKNLVDVNNYDFIIADVISLSFTCNIYHNHSLSTKIKSSSGFLLEKILKILHYKRIAYAKSYYINCPKVVTVSNLVKKDLIQNYNISQNKIIVAYPGTNNNEIIYEKEKNDIFTIGVSACGFATKGGFNVLKAIKFLKNNYPDFKFKVKIINPKYKKHSFLGLYLKLCKISDIVEMLPYQTDINKFYSSVDCFVCASRFDAFGRVVTEAMLNKIPVIVGSNIGASEIIKNGINGFIFKYDNNRHKNLANKIIEAYNQREKFYNITENAFETAKQLNWQNFAKTIFENLYK